MKNQSSKPCAAAQPEHVPGDRSPTSFDDKEYHSTEMKVRKVPIEKIMKVATILDFSHEGK